MTDVPANEAVDVESLVAQATDDFLERIGRGEQPSRSTSAGTRRSSR